MLMPSASETDGPGWETKTWHEIRGRVRERKERQRTAQAAPGLTPLAATMSDRPSVTANPAGQGNADEWLDSGPQSLTPDAPALPAVQRLRLRYRKVGPARFIGTREIGNVFLRASRRAARIVNWW